MPAKGSGIAVPSITKSMIVQDILVLCPAAQGIMTEYGLHCSSCSFGGLEPLGEGCQMHGFDDETIDALVDDINESLAEQKPAKECITVTKDAAEALTGVMKSEGQESIALQIELDGHGGFCMEFTEDETEADAVFFHKDYPRVRVLCSEIILWRIGGAVIDFREDRFKLDLPEDIEMSGCCKGEDACACRDEKG